MNKWFSRKPKQKPWNPSQTFLHNRPENWSTQVHMYAYAHESQPLSELNLSPYEIVFHTIPRILINFELNLEVKDYL